MTELKSTDIKMSELTMKQQREIKAVDGISIEKARTKIVAEGVAKMHKKLFKPGDVIKTMGSDTHE